MRYNDDWKEFWWTKITGAHTVVNRVAMTLLENKTVILKVPSDLLWRDAMRSSVHDLFSERCNNDVVIEFIDLLDDDPDDSEPGRLILEKFADSSVKNGYREKSQLTIQKYIISKRVIANRIIWVKGFTEKTAAKWIKFCKNFSPKSTEDGLFVIEIRNGTLSSESKYKGCIDFDSCVSSYDVQLFNSFVLDEQNKYSSNWKRYISAGS